MGWLGEEPRARLATSQLSRAGELGLHGDRREHPARGSAELRLRADGARAKERAKDVECNAICVWTALSLQVECPACGMPSGADETTDP